MVFKIGIISTADIARKVTDAIHNSGVAVPYAVGSRNLEKSQKFANENKITKAYGTYEEVINDPEIDAVYVPLPTAMRTKWCVLAANAGKHLLVDKPILSAADAEEIVATCKKNKVHMMDATMFMHHKRLVCIKNHLSGNPDLLGPVQRVNSCFSISIMHLTENIRLSAELEPYGCVGDLSWYCSRMILWGFDFELPEECFATINFKEGCPIDCTAQFTFKGGDRFAQLNSSFHNCTRQHCEIVGTKGTLYMKDYVLPYFCEKFWLPQNMDKYSEKTEYTIQDLNGVETKYQVDDCLQVVEMIRTFTKDCQAVKQGGEASKPWGEYSIKTMKMLDAIMKSAKAKQVVTI